MNSFFFFCPSLAFLLIGSPNTITSLVSNLILVISTSIQIQKIIKDGKCNFLLVVITTRFSFKFFIYELNKNLEFKFCSLKDVRKQNLDISHVSTSQTYKACNQKIMYGDMSLCLNIMLMIFTIMIK